MVKTRSQIRQEILNTRMERHQLRSNSSVSPTRSVGNVADLDSNFKILHDEYTKFHADYEALLIRHDDVLQTLLIAIKDCEILAAQNKHVKDMNHALKLVRRRDKLQFLKYATEHEIQRHPFHFDAILPITSDTADNAIVNEVKPSNVDESLEANADEYFNL